jgi:predicted  nucleic acid-binding Zn-ribbon protein
MKTKTDILGRLLPMVTTLTPTNDAPEMTLQEFGKIMAEALLVLAETMQNGFDRIDERLDSLNNRVDNLELEFQDMKTRIIRLEYSMGDVQEMLVDLTHAEEKDAIATMNHEDRIIRLEKISDIYSVSPSHLTDIET